MAEPHVTKDPIRVTLKRLLQQSQLVILSNSIDCIFRQLPYSSDCPLLWDSFMGSFMALFPTNPWCFISSAILFVIALQSPFYCWRRPKGIPHGQGEEERPQTAEDTECDFQEPAKGRWIFAGSDQATRKVNLGVRPTFLQLSQYQSSFYASISEKIPSIAW